MASTEIAARRALLAEEIARTELLLTLPGEGDTDVAAAAAAYATLGWLPIPLCTPTCRGHGGRPCTGAGKVPVLSGWQGGVGDVQGVPWQDYNVGLALGGPARLVVLDVDGPQGLASLTKLEAHHGALPPTLSALTGRGTHFYFVVPAGIALPGNSAGRLGAGLDVRGQGGQVVAPPSLHASGRRYTWGPRLPIAEAPPWLAPAAGAHAPTCRATEASVDPPQEPPPAPPPPTDLEPLWGALRKRAGNLRRRGELAHAELRGRVVARRALAEPGARDATLLVVAGLLSWALPLGTPAEVAVALLSGSIVAMDLEPEGSSYWLEAAAEKFRRASDSRTATEAGTRSARASTLSRVLALAPPRVLAGGSTAPIDYSGAPDTPAPPRPEIRIGTDTHRLIREAAEAIGADPSVYCRGGRLVRVLQEDPILSPPIVTPIPHVLVEAALTEHSDWRTLRITAEGESWVSAIPPPRIVTGVSDLGHWPTMVRRLEGVIETPTLRPDGTMITEPGYDSATGLLLVPHEEIDPLGDDPQVAVATLLDVFADFPTDRDCHRAAIVAMILTLAARHAIAGPTPLFLVEGNVRGAGKTLLAIAAAIVGLGRVPPMIRWPAEPDEQQKKNHGNCNRRADDCIPRQLNAHPRRRPTVWRPDHHLVPGSNLGAITNDPTHRAPGGVGGHGQ